MYELYLKCDLSNFTAIASLVNHCGCKVSRLAVLAEDTSMDKSFTTEEFVVLPKGSLFVVAHGNKSHVFNLQREGLCPFFVVDQQVEKKIVYLPITNYLESGIDLPNWKALEKFMPMLENRYEELKKNFIEHSDKFERLNDVDLMIELGRFFEKVADDFEFGAGPDLF